MSSGCEVCLNEDTQFKSDLHNRQNSSILGIQILMKAKVEYCEKGLLQLNTLHAVSEIR